MQLMQLYVQKSTSTTRPRSADIVSGRPPGVLNHVCVSVKSGAAPSTGSGALRVACARPACALARCAPRSEASPRLAAALVSSELLGLTRNDGRSLATAVSKRVSRSKSISVATHTITAPIAIWKRSLLGASREVSRRPPSMRTYSAAAEPMP